MDNVPPYKIIEKFIGSIHTNTINITKLTLPLISNTFEILDILLKICEIGRVDALQYINLYYNNIIETFDTKTLEQLYTHSVRYNNLDIVNYLLDLCDYYRDVSRPFWTWISVKYNNLTILKLLISKKYTIRVDILSELVILNNVEMFIYLHKLGYKWKYDDRFKAIQTDSLYILKYIDKIDVQNCTFSSQSTESHTLNKLYQYPINLCLHGNIAMIEYLHNRNELYSELIMNYACDKKKCNLIRYLYEIGCGFSDTALVYICVNGLLCQIKFILDKGIKFPPFAFDIVCKHDYTIIVEYLIDNENVGTDMALEHAIENNNKYMMDLLIKHHSYSETLLEKANALMVS